MRNLLQTGLVSKTKTNRARGEPLARTTKEDVMVTKEIKNKTLFSKEEAEKIMHALYAIEPGKPRVELEVFHLYMSYDEDIQNNFSDDPNDPFRFVGTKGTVIVDRKRINNVWYGYYDKTIDVPKST